MYSRSIRAVAVSLTCYVFASASTGGIALGQQPSKQEGIVARKDAPVASAPVSETPNSGATTSATLIRYYHPEEGTSSEELIRTALVSNADLVAARFDVERARGRLRQAGLRANPTVDFEHTTGNLTGSPGERETSIGFSLPLELNGERQRRVDLAKAELEAAQAEISDRERRLVAELRASYAEALAAARELEITEGLSNLDTQTARIVEARVSEGESAPIELNLLRAEVDRLRSRRALVEGRLQLALLRLKTLAGVSPNESLRLKEDLAAPAFSKPPASVGEAVEIALRTRPDLRLAHLLERVAEAGFEFARAQARPDVSAFTRYSRSRSVFDDTPVGAIRDKDNTLSFGVSLSIPLFNRNQGAKAEAAAAITQARCRREFAEQVVRADVASAFARYEAAQSAAAIFEQGVMARSRQNIKSIRGAYELGAFRMTELLAEQRRMMDSQREYTEALTERYKALADLLSAMGVPATTGTK